jgi:hypothetical protein
MGFSPGLLRPALKRMIKVEVFSATLKRCFPLLKQRAPTLLGAPFLSSHAEALAPASRPMDALFSCPAPIPLWLSGSGIHTAATGLDARPLRYERRPGLPRPALLTEKYGAIYSTSSRNNFFLKSSGVSLAG